VRLFYPWADVRAIVSSDAADDLAALSGLPRSLIEVVNNPLDLPNEAASADCDSIWGDATERVITVGTLKQQKNHALLLAAFARLLKRRPSARLVILGEGELRTQLEALSVKLGIADRITMAGFVLDPSPYYASAHVFVLSSDYEGFGNVLVEALHAGLRVVSTDCPCGPAEILENGRYGSLVPCGDVEALSRAMDEQFGTSVDAQRLKDRARQLSGAGAIERYREMLLGPALGHPQETA
jgi:glycosyltransferase involved in cell wall biosynthesis